MPDNEKDFNRDTVNHPFESIESKREFYEQNIDKYKHAIDDQIGQISSEAKDKAKTGLIVLGAAVVSIWLIRKMFSSSSKSKSKVKKRDLEKAYQSDMDYNRALYVQPKQENQIVAMIKSSIAAFLLAIAKEKIANFIENMNARKDEDQQFPNTSSTKTTARL